MNTLVYNDKRDIGPLTQKQLDYLQALADGSAYNDIGQTFHASYASVKQIVARASRKLGADNKTHAIAQAMRRGLIK